MGDYVGLTQWTDRSSKKTNKAIKKTVEAVEAVADAVVTVAGLDELKKADTGDDKTKKRKSAKKQKASPKKDD